MLHTSELTVLDQDRNLVSQWQSRLPEILASPDEVLEVMREIMEPANLISPFGHNRSAGGHAALIYYL